MNRLHPPSIDGFTVWMPQIHRTEQESTQLIFLLLRWV